MGNETLTPTDPVWFSHNRFQYGVAKHYAMGRDFLAGDAGHHILPIGGQGMNADMTDGIGIAWRWLWHAGLATPCSVPTTASARASTRPCPPTR